MVHKGNLFMEIFGDNADMKLALEGWCNSAPCLRALVLAPITAVLYQFSTFTGDWTPWSCFPSLLVYLCTWTCPYNGILASHKGVSHWQVWSISNCHCISPVFSLHAWLWGSIWHPLPCQQGLEYTGNLWSVE